jgi:hypothetical protein
VLTISRLSRWSINYYSDTANAAQAAAMDRQSAGGGLGEYYSERDTRVPTWIVVGDTAAVGELTGLDAAALHGRRAHRAEAWRQCSSKNRARAAALERINATQEAQRERSRSRDEGVGLEF